MSTNYKVLAIHMAADSGGLGPQNKYSFREGKEDHARMTDEPEHQRVIVHWSPPAAIGTKDEIHKHWVVPYGQIRYMEIEPFQAEKK